MTALTDRPTPEQDRISVLCEVVRQLRAALSESKSERDALRAECANWREIAGNNADERDSLRAANLKLAEQVKALREAASMSLSVLLAVANGETDDYPERCRAAATCARAALASTETEVQP